MNARSQRELRRLPVSDRSHVVTAASDAVWSVADPDEGPAPEDNQDLDEQLCESVGELYESLQHDPQVCDGLIEFMLATLRAAGLVETEATLRMLVRDAQLQGDNDAD